jgi:hypothetical protein
MLPRSLSVSRPVGRAVLAIVLCVVFYQRAAFNLSHVDYRNSNFFFFWLAGHMAWTGENPYDSTQWLAAHDTYGVSWRPNSIFPYPLPLEFVLAPLGLLSLPDAYFWWIISSEMLLAAAVWVQLTHLSDPQRGRLFVPLILALLFFGPVYLTLQIGALGAFTVAVLVGAIVALQRRAFLLAGVLLSLTLLKPPQGVTIMLLAGTWLLAQRNWKALEGIFLGIAVLFGVGLARDPLWLSKFATAGQAVMERTMGIQSNTFGYAYVLCSRNEACMWIVGGSVAAAILVWAAWALATRGAQLSPWEAFGLIIPIAFATTLYLWSYDEIPYVIPIVWIAAELVRRTASYWAGAGFVILVVVTSVVALYIEATTRLDLMSGLTTVLVLGLGLWLITSRPRPQLAAAVDADV